MSCFDSAMETFVRRVLVTLVLAAFLLASPAQASDDQPWTDPHVRALEPCRPTLIDDARRLSPTVDGLLHTLDQSDLVVHVRCAFFKGSSISGRLSFLGAVAGRRYVVAEIKMHDQYGSQIATLAHELQHAVEVAAAPSIRDSATLAKHYRLIGITIDNHPMIFETMAAREIAERVHRELFAVGARNRVAEASVGSR